MPLIVRAYLPIWRMQTGRLPPFMWFATHSQQRPWFLQSALGQEQSWVLLQTAFCSMWISLPYLNGLFFMARPLLLSLTAARQKVKFAAAFFLPRRFLHDMIGRN
jgi:hypothetical protein